MCMTMIELQASLFNLPPRMEVLGSTEAIGTFLHDSGYGGLQYTPVRTPYSHRFDELAEEGYVTSFQQSWAHGLHPAQVVFRTVLSGVKASTERIEQLRERLPIERRGETPTIVHPNEQYLGGRPRTGRIDYNAWQRTGVLGPLLYQPTVEVLHAWGRLQVLPADKAADSLMSAQIAYGFDNIALDLHHITTERAGMQLSPDWVDAFVARLAANGALANNSEVQVALRPDFGGEPGDAVKVMEGDFIETRAGELLGIIKANLPEGQERLRVTTEIPPGAFRRSGGYRMGNQAVCAAIRGMFGMW